MKFSNVQDLVHSIYENRSKSNNASASRCPCPFPKNANSFCLWYVSFPNTPKMICMLHTAYWDTLGDDDSYIPYHIPIVAAWGQSIYIFLRNVETLHDSHHSTIVL